MTAPAPSTPLRAVSALRRFLAAEAAGGLLLIAASALAMLAANVPATAALYRDALHAATGPVINPALGPMTVHLWVNDALMAVFFLFVGLEIKREFVDGELSNPADRRLPIVAAAAGMTVPALVYLSVAGANPALVRGWAIPAATDIAFAMGIMALLGKRVPAALKLFLTTVAIVDDMGAVAIIAVAYTDTLNLAPLAAAAGMVGLLWAAGRRWRSAVWTFVIGFPVVWLLVVASGVHATIAGVATAFAVPIHLSPGGPESSLSPLHRIEHALAPWVGYLIVPLFGFANAGVSLAGMGPETFAEPLVLGIALGLFLGKQAGILGAVWGAERIGFARRPGQVSWPQLYGAALLAGIGFTMSLFIGGLAFGGPALSDRVKLGVLAGSLLSATLGYAVLHRAGRRHA